MKHIIMIFMAILLGLTNPVSAKPPTNKATPAAVNTATSNTNSSTQSQTCLNCHKALTGGIVNQWKLSSHSNKGVGCYFPFLLGMVRVTVEKVRAFRSRCAALFAA